MKNLKPKFKVSQRKNGTKRVQIDCSEEKLTDQSYKNMSDINNIVANYHKTGVLPSTREKVAQYIDTTEIPDLIEAHELISHAKSMFMELPAHIRKLMDNDPRNLEAFVSDPANKEHLVKYGLIEDNRTQGSHDDKKKKKSSSPKPPTSEASKQETSESGKITE